MVIESIQIEGGTFIVVVVMLAAMYREVLTDYLMRPRRKKPKNKKRKKRPSD